MRAREFELRRWVLDPEQVNHGSKGNSIFADGAEVEYWPVTSRGSLEEGLIFEKMKERMRLTYYFLCIDTDQVQFKIPMRAGFRAITYSEAGPLTCIHLDY